MRRHALLAFSYVDLHYNPAGVDDKTKPGYRLHVPPSLALRRVQVDSHVGEKLHHATHADEQPVKGAILFHQAKVARKSITRSEGRSTLTAHRSIHPGAGATPKCRNRYPTRGATGRLTPQRRLHAGDTSQCRKQS